MGVGAWHVVESELDSATCRETVRSLEVDIDIDVVIDKHVICLESNRA